MDKTDNVRVIVSGKVSHAKRRPATLLDKDFSIFPATMMVEGAYYPYVEKMQTPQSLHFSAKELRQSVNTWNGRPVAINHPKGETTCNSPDTFNKQWVGYVFNAHYDSSNRALKAELWIEDERGKTVNDLILAGKQLEVSIGAFGDLKPYSGTEAYDYSFTNIIGDHLAVLPDSRGACSWEDGCGVRASELQVSAVRNKARTPSYDGVESTSWGSVTKSLEAYVKAYYRAKGMDQPSEVGSDAADLPSAVKAWVASKTLLGEADANNSRDLLFFPVVNPKTNKLNEGALKAVISGRGAQADISEGARTSAQNKARSLLESKFKKKVNMRGEDVSECVEEKMTKEECLETKVEAKATPTVSVKPENEGSFSVESWLNDAPDSLRGHIVNLMRKEERRREGLINKIVSCKEVAFCEKALGRVATEDMSILEGIADLIDLASQKADQKVVPMEQNYQLRTASGVQATKKPTYAAFKDIDYVEMQKERLEKERVKRYGR